MIRVAVQAEPFDANAETARLTDGRTDVGAVVAFTGLCRADDQLLALEIEHYPGMADAELRRVAAAAVERWSLIGATLVHRYGRLEPGDPIVLAIAASAHRQAAFEAASFLMDYLKTSAPFWKKEHRVEAGQTSWVAAKASDDAAAERWS